jgi:hypothetical protein
LRTSTFAHSHQKSFHMAAEKHVRIELWNMVGGAMTSFTSQGDIVLTCYAGEFRLESSTETSSSANSTRPLYP